MTIKNRFPLAVSYDSNNDPSGLAEFEPKTTDLSDIGDSTPSTGQVLTWTDDGKYQPQTPTGGGAVNSVNDLTGDVSLYLSSLSGVTFTDLGGATNEGDGLLPQHIQWNGSEWINQFEDEQYLLIRNETGLQLTQGQAVYISGVQGEVPLVGLADASDSTKMPCVGLVHETIDDARTGLAVTFGTGKLSTDIEGTVAIGKTAYVSPTTPGRLTVDKPNGATELIQNVGIVIRTNSGTQRVKVTSVGRSNDIPNTIALGPAGETTITAATAKFTGTTANEIVITNTSNQIDSIASGTLFSQSIQVTGTVAAHSDVESGDGFGDRTLLIYDGNNSTWKALSLIQVLDIGQGGAFPGGIDLPGDATNLVDHGSNLSGLGDDDHTQYVLSAGTRSMSALTVNNEITTKDIEVTRLGQGRPTNFTWTSDYLAPQVFQNGWLQAFGTGGSIGGDSSMLNQYQDVAGIISLGVNSNSSARASMYTNNDTLYASGQAWSFATRACMQSASVAGATYSGVIGVANNATDYNLPSYGVYFYCGYGGGNWIARTTGQFGNTETDTGVALSSYTLSVLQIMCNEDWSKAEFYIDGNKVATHTTNLPNRIVNTGFLYKLWNNGAASAGGKMYVDWHDIKLINTSVDRGEGHIKDFSDFTP